MENLGVIERKLFVDWLREYKPSDFDRFKNAVTWQLAKEILSDHYKLYWREFREYLKERKA